MLTDKINQVANRLKYSLTIGLVSSMIAFSYANDETFVDPKLESNEGSFTLSGDVKSAHQYCNMFGYMMATQVDFDKSEPTQRAFYEEGWSIKPSTKSIKSIVCSKHGSKKLDDNINSIVNSIFNRFTRFGKTSYSNNIAYTRENIQQTMDNDLINYYKNLSKFKDNFVALHYVFGNTVVKVMEIFGENLETIMKNTREGSVRAILSIDPISFIKDSNLYVGTSIIYRKKASEVNKNIPLSISQTGEHTKDLLNLMNKLSAYDAKLFFKHIKPEELVKHFDFFLEAIKIDNFIASNLRWFPYNLLEKDSKKLLKHLKQLGAKDSLSSFYLAAKKLN
tara:strand:- start:2544 stop:3551 length:1008 start_codon:yes stop_codon:yes gene_type:complete